MVNFTVSNSPFSVGQDPQALDQGDFNNDGNLDIVTVNRDDSNISILLGDGAGSFSDANNFGILPEIAFFHDVAVSDFNNDDNLDIVVNFYRSEEDTSYAILFGNGSGQFEEQVNLGLDFTSSIIHSTTSVTASDFDQDGDSDLIFSSIFNPTVIVSLGDGNGNFSETISLSDITNPRNIVTQDLNRDGNLDLVVSSSRLLDELSLVYGDNSVESFLIQEYSIENSGEQVVGSIRDFVVEDFNNDGHLDLVASGTTDLFLAIGDGEGGFLAPEENQIGFLNEDTTQEVDRILPFDLQSADFNLDGNADLVVTSNRTTLLLFGDGEGNFSNDFSFDDNSRFEEVENYVNSGTISVGDFNSDGISDFATIDYINSSNDVTLVLSEDI